MIDIEPVLGMLDAFSLAREKLSASMQNLKDMETTLQKLPGRQCTFIETVKWWRENRGWEVSIGNLLACLKKIEEALTEEGYDRWFASPDDGGVPF